MNRLSNNIQTELYTGETYKTPCEEGEETTCEEGEETTCEEGEEGEETTCEEGEVTTCEEGEVTTCEEGEETTCEEGENWTVKKPTLFENTDVYVVSIDDAPEFYTGTLEKAHIKMMELARYLAISEYYTTYINNKLHKGEIVITGYHKHSLIRCSQTLYKLKTYKIKEIA
jgi:hypothetical protein